MKLAIIGSRTLGQVDIEKYLPEGVDEIVSGGARGIDSLARAFAESAGIKLTEFLPQYQSYGRAAPLVRNRQIADYADAALVFWDGSSRGTKYTVEIFEELGKRVTLIIIRTTLPS